MTTTVTRRLEFDYGHRVLRHESKCANLHGHRGRIDITVRAVSGSLDPLGRVIDFGVVKKILGQWIDEKWDHNILLNSEDPLASLWIGGKGQFKVQDIYQIFGSKPPFLFDNANPTAEIMAACFYNTALNLLPPGIRPVRVRFYETPNNFADYFE